MMICRSFVQTAVCLVVLLVSPLVLSEPTDHRKNRHDKQGFYMDDGRSVQFETAEEMCSDAASNAEYIDGDGVLVTFTAYPVDEDTACEVFNSKDPTKRKWGLRFLCGWGERARPKKANWLTGGHDLEGCFCWDGGVYDEAIQWCVYDTKDNGCPNENGRGNPCHVATGNKFQQETDIAFGPITFARSYNSVAQRDFGLGKGWTHTYLKRLLLSFNSSNDLYAANLKKISQSGKSVSWHRSSGSVGPTGLRWVVSASSSESEYVEMRHLDNEYTFTHRSGKREVYNADGLLIREVEPNGVVVSLTYNGAQNLTSVENSYGQRLSLNYHNQQLVSIDGPSGETYRYIYDNQNNLIEVIYPDETPQQTNDNPSRRYFYEDARHPNHLTGIEDENGHRYASWAYDELGRAVLSEHSQTSNAVGQEKVELDFQWEE